ncbi:MAG: hypothetical protein JWN23_1201 [Rhodocyclales bacterium]|nr:hypothetical protein [Rhodocyclales bacterium]
MLSPIRATFPCGNMSCELLNTVRQHLGTLKHSTAGLVSNTRLGMQTLYEQLITTLELNQ